MSFGRDLTLWIHHLTHGGLKTGYEGIFRSRVGGWGILLFDLHQGLCSVLAEQPILCDLKKGFPMLTTSVKSIDRNATVTCRSAEHHFIRCLQLAS